MKGEFLSILLIGAILLFGSPKLEATVVTFTPNEALPVNVPDNNATPTARTFTVTGVPANSIVNSVSLSLNMNHTWIGDLRGTLTSPDNEVHTLFYDIGDTNSPANAGDSSNLLGNYVMSDAGATTLWTAAEGGTSLFNIPPGTYRTTNINVNTPTNMNGTFGYPGAPFNEFLEKALMSKSPGENTEQVTNGIWTLRISDNAAGDTGSINVGTALNIDFSVTTAANALLSGRLVTSGGSGVMNASVRITNAATNEVRTTRCSSMGYFRFDELPTGNTYIIEVESKRFQFSPRILQLDDSVTDLVMQAGDQ